MLALLDDRRVYCIFEIQLRPMKMILCLDAVSKVGNGGQMCTQSLIWIPPLLGHT